MFTNKPFWYGVLLTPVIALSGIYKANAEVIDFDFDAFGAPIGHLQLIDDEYAAIGVHFTGGFYAGKTSIAFPTYTVRPSPNYLCTFGGTAGGGNPRCRVPADGGGRALLGVIFDFPVLSASIEGFTRNDGVEDTDSLIIQAFDKNNVLLGSSTDFCTNKPSPFRPEGVCLASISAVGIRSLIIDPNRDFVDALDTLTFEQDESPPSVPEPTTLILLGLGLIALRMTVGRKSRRE